MRARLIPAIAAACLVTILFPPIVRAADAHANVLLFITDDQRYDALAHGSSRQRAQQKGYINQIFGDDAVAFLSSTQAKEKPFLLWLALTAPHAPIKPNPPDIEQLYAGKSKQDLMPAGFPKDRDAADWRHYYEACTMADRQLGNVLDALQKNDLTHSTLVIFLGDNGFMMGDRDLTVNGKNRP